MQLRIKVIRVLLKWTALRISQIVSQVRRTKPTISYALHAFMQNSTWDSQLTAACKEKTDECCGSAEVGEKIIDRNRKKKRQLWAAIKLRYSANRDKKHRANPLQRIRLLLKACLLSSAPFEGNVPSLFGQARSPRLQWTKYTAHGTCVDELESCYCWSSHCGGLRVLWFLGMCRIGGTSRSYSRNIWKLFYW